MKPGQPHKKLSEKAGYDSIENFDKLRYSNKGSSTTADIRMKMQKTMQNHAAVFREGPVMQEGCRKLEECISEFKDNLHVQDQSLIWNTDLVETLELQNLL